MSEQLKYILWDWNGTLLNDLDASIESMNELLSRRQLPQLSKRHYQEIFDFPVFNYYETLGFDFVKENWEDVAAEYMNSYHSKEAHFKLYPEAELSLKILKAGGYKHFILSAMKQESIITMLQHFDIKDYFKDIYGSNDHYANGKINRAQQLLKEQNIRPEECLLVGDTTHDAEVAHNIGVKCILISHGHHNHQRLSATAHPTYTSITEWLNKF